MTAQTAERVMTAFNVTIRCEQCDASIGQTYVDPEYEDGDLEGYLGIDISTDLMADVRHHAIDAHGWLDDEDGVEGDDLPS
jgi:hypothetical protein